MPEEHQAAPRNEFAEARRRRNVWVALGAIVLVFGLVAVALTRPGSEIVQVLPTPAAAPNTGDSNPAASLASLATAIASPTIPVLTPTPSALVVAGTGNVGVSLRSAPSTTAQRLAVLREGTRLEDRLEERQAEGRAWKRVGQAGGPEGWVAAEFLTTPSPDVIVSAPAASPGLVFPPASAAATAPAAATSFAPIAAAEPTPIPVTLIPSNRPGAVRVAPQGDDCPATHRIKAVATTGSYHIPDNPAYATIRPEACFATIADAEAAGFKAVGR